jgi:glutamate 5-kinase
MTGHPSKTFAEIPPGRMLPGLKITTERVPLNPDYATEPAMRGVMADSIRNRVFASAKTIVIKVGTNVLTDAKGQLDRQRVTELIEQLVRLQAAGRRIALVTSGAIGAGVGQLQLGRRPSDLPHLQACAAVGQCVLMQLYQAGFANYHLHAAQILLTAGDVENRKRYLNVRNTLFTLWEYGCVPIINENDTVSVAEIKFGDNDHLAAIVTNLVQAPLLILLTNVDGLFTSDPTQNPAAERLELVEGIDRSVTAMASATRSVLGSGGMRSKLRAARLATAAGSAVIMANGSVPGILDRLSAGESLGTLFLPQGESLPAWKRWLGFTARPVGSLRVDAGAHRAVVEQGRSLLPVGIRRVEGQFSKGDLVRVCTLDGVEIARGLSNYAAAELSRLAGQNTEQILSTLGKIPYVECIHRDNLVITGE